MTATATARRSKDSLCLDLGAASKHSCLPMRSSNTSLSSLVFFLMLFENRQMMRLHPRYSIMYGFHRQKPHPCPFIAITCRSPENIQRLPGPRQDYAVSCLKASLHFFHFSWSRASSVQHWRNWFRSLRHLLCELLWPLLTGSRYQVCAILAHIIGIILSKHLLKLTLTLKLTPRLI